MRQVTLYDLTTGQLGPQIFNTQQVIDMLVGDRLNFVDGHWPADQWRVDVQTGEMVVRTPDIQEAREERWRVIKRARDKAANGTCVTDLGPVDCDETSRTNISGAVQMAMLAQIAGQDFSIPWTMADNTVVDHNGAQMIAMGVQVGQHVATCFAIAQNLRPLIDQATNVADLDAILWPAS